MVILKFYNIICCGFRIMQAVPPSSVKRIGAFSEGWISVLLIQFMAEAELLLSFASACRTSFSISFAA